MTEPRDEAGEAARKLLHRITHHPHSTTGAVGAENCSVCLRAIAAHTEAHHCGGCDGSDR
jgi:hypothetical protein